MRQLASVQRILNLEPIPGADRIEKATILGWEVVVAKGDFKVGDLCVYFEIDSQLPKDLIFEFMMKRKYRVKTCRLQKQISQGLAMPTSILSGYKVNLKKIKEGMDVTEAIGVVKYDPQTQQENAQNEKPPKSKILKFLFKYELFRKVWTRLFPKNKGNFPDFLVKTDETRIQNFPWMSQKHHRKAFYATEKLDGQSLTVFYNKKLNNKLQPWVDNAFGVCSRNLWLKTPNDTTWWTIAKRFDMENKLRELGMNIAIQGEIIGEGIQGNKYGIKGIDFYAFSAYDIDEKRYFNKEEKEILFGKLGLKMVPLHYHLLMDEEKHDVHFFVELSKIKSFLNPKTLAEGLVIRNVVDDKVSFKVISPDFLLKNDE